MLLSDVVFWLGIGMLAGGLYWRVRLRRSLPAGVRTPKGGPAVLMLGGVVLALAGLYLVNAI
ncbi:MAG: hypothetical protein OXN15_03260 [Chloroflexota bacterium]|nr:hypothetical protein [Chloroflexota bacterium]MDE2969110.1 hypothetical protein [Chloroflexota bacterium]